MPPAVAAYLSNRIVPHGRFRNTVCPSSLYVKRTPGIALPSSSIADQPVKSAGPVSVPVAVTSAHLPENLAPNTVGKT